MNMPSYYWSVWLFNFISKLKTSFLSFYSYFSYSRTMNYYTRLLIKFVFWIIAFFKASNLLSFNKSASFSAQSLFMKDINDWIKLVSMYLLNNCSSLIYLLLYLWFFWKFCFCPELLLLVICDIWLLVKLLPDSFLYF